MDQITVEATPREERGKNAARRRRRGGEVPAVLYGGKGGAEAVSLNAKQLNAILRSETGHNAILRVKLPNGEHPAMVKDWQVDPVAGTLIHVDLLRIAMDVRMHVRIPVHTFGEPQGVKLQGGIFEMVLREVEIECLPSEIPTEFRVDISELMIGTQLRAGDIPIDKDKMKLVSDPQQVVAHVVALRAEEEKPAEAVAAEAAATPAEPEVIKKGKKEVEEGEEGAEAEEKPEKSKKVSGEAAMKLIVGLGNAGVPYVFTPHNLGFLAVERFAERAGIHITRPEAKSLVGLGKWSGQEVALAEPQTMMNLSGLAVRDLLGRLDIGPDDLIVLYDDVALPWGMLRVRERGTAGGHNGMKSVIGAVGTMEFARVRLGIKPEHPVSDLADYVLRPMRKAELETAAEMTDQAADAVEAILTVGTAQAMNRFNRRGPSDDESDEEAGAGEASKE